MELFYVYIHETLLWNEKNSALDEMLVNTSITRTRHFFASDIN